MDHQELGLTRRLAGLTGEKQGLFFAVLAYTTWGLFPLFWKQLGGIPYYTILAHRTFWAAVFFVLLLGLARGLVPARATLRTIGRKHWLPILGSALLIGSNWGTYIYAVNAGHILEASLGYFINPLMNVVLGMVFLGERMSRAQWIAVGLAIVGVGQMAAQADHVPWLALWMAFSFAMYGLIRKKVSQDPLAASTVEALMLAVPALLFLAFALLGPRSLHGEAGWGQGTLLILAGAVTAVPLWLFVEGGARLPLSTLGFLQYISPSLQFLLAVFVYGEHFETTHARSFGCIWLALLVYVFSTRVRSDNKSKTWWRKIWLGNS